MADQDKKISELTETTNPASMDVLPISTANDTYKVSATNLISKTTLTGVQTAATTVPGAINELKNGQNFTAGDNVNISNKVIGVTGYMTASEAHTIWNNA